MKKVVIVGAGVCGLTAAYRLQQQGFEVEVLDARHYSGGRTRTVEEHGCKIDQGASLLVSSYVEALSLARELGMGDQLVSVPGKSATYIDGVFHPLQMDDHVLKMFMNTPYLSMKSKLSMARMLPALIKYRSKLNLHDLSGAADSDTETAKAFCDRLVAPEVYDKMINPLLRGMYIANGEDVSVTQLLWILTHYSGVKVFGFAQGMQALANTLASRVKVRYGVKVSQVNEVADGAEIIAEEEGKPVTYKGDYCVIATDGKDLQTLFGHALSQAQNAFLTQLTYAPIKMVTYVTSRQPDVKAVLSMPTQQDDPDLALIVMDHLYGPSRTPPGVGMISFLAMDYIQNRWLADTEHQELVKFGDARLKKYFPEVVDSVTSVDTRAWDRASTVGVPGNYRHLSNFVRDIKADSKVLYTGDYMVASSVGVAASTGNAVAKRLAAQEGI